MFITQRKIKIKPLNEKQVLRQAVKIILKYLSNDTKEIFLFGSRAKKLNREFSDFDIGIHTNHPVPFDKLQRIEDEFDEMQTLKSFDIIDFSAVSNEFKIESLKNRKVLYHVH